MRATRSLILMRRFQNSAIALTAGLMSVGLVATSGLAVQAVPLLAQITSSDQIEDVDSSDVFYPALERLIENYGINLAYADNTFRPDEVLTYGEFALGLNQAMDSLDRMGWTPPPAPMAARMQEPVDLERTNAYFEAVELLSVRYGVNLVVDGTFEGNLPITEAVAADYINQATGLALTGAEETLTRGEFAILLDQVMAQSMASL
jgi:phosphotransacetylase